MCVGVLVHVCMGSSWGVPCSPSQVRSLTLAQSAQPHPSCPLQPLARDQGREAVPSACFCEGSCCEQSQECPLGGAACGAFGGLARACIES